MTYCVTRRATLKGLTGVVAGAAFFVAGATQASAATTVNLSDYGSVNAADNHQAIQNAADAAGPGGTIVVSPGVWNTSTVNLNAPVKIIGKSPTTTRFAFTSGAYGLSVNGGAGGTLIQQMGFYSAGGGTSAYVRSTADVTVDSCDLYEPAQFGCNPAGGTLTVTNTRFIGQAKSIGFGIRPENGASVNASGSTFSGLYAGLYAAGAGDITSRNNTFLGLWFFSNPTICPAKVASSTSTSVTATSALPKKDFQANATAVAWKTMTSSATVTPVSGKSTWFTISGTSIEPRMMIRNGSQFGVIMDVQGNQARIPYWHTFSSCYPRDVPTATQTGMIVERPYIGRVTSISGSTVNVKSWHAGEKGTYENPPAGARLQVNDITTYQCFSTDNTKSFTVDTCVVFASWADQISSIGGQNVKITNNTVYDGQDVGITLEKVTNGCTATGNASHRAGTAAIYFGSNSVQGGNNTSWGANLMTDDDLSYAAFTIQGAPYANIWSNTAHYLGAPKEHYAIYIEGRVGQDNSSPAAQQQPPYATDLNLNSNAYSGYPQYDVNISGTHSFVDKAHTTWAAGTRPHADTASGATLAMLGF